MENNVQSISGSSDKIIRIESEGWEGIAFKIQRSRIEACNDINELKGPGIYILFSKDGAGSDCAYVGKAKNVIERLNDHCKKGEEWYECAAFVSKLQIYSSHAAYLENKVFLMAMLGRYKKMNRLLPEGEPLRQEDMIIMEKFMQPMNAILIQFGQDVLEPVWADRNEALVDEKKNYAGSAYYFTHQSGRPYAIGKAEPNGFLVLKGSLTSYLVADSAPLRKELERNGKIDSVTKVFTESVLFKDATSAATVVWGCKTSASQWRKSQSDEG